MRLAQFLPCFIDSFVPNVDSAMLESLHVRAAMSSMRHAGSIMFNPLAISDWSAMPRRQTVCSWRTSPAWNQTNMTPRTAFANLCRWQILAPAALPRATFNSALAVASWLESALQALSRHLCIFRQELPE
jgi:hypothetical protein